VDVKDFLELVEHLTGTPVKALEEREHRFVAQALRDDSRQLDWTQFNELLLLVNKDRVEAPFFDRYFGRGCRVAEIRQGVLRFQKEAMLLYGNFVFAYRTLSRIPTQGSFETRLGDLFRDPAELRGELKARSPKILEIEPISRDKTYLVGYLSAKEISLDKTYADSLYRVGTRVQSGQKPSWDEMLRLTSTEIQEDQRPHVLRIVAKYRQRNKEHDVAAFVSYLENDVLPQLRDRVAELASVQQQATRNQDVYLTWDHMDVYFATSMRKRWEFEDLYDLVKRIMGRAELAELNIRYFDPTQSFTKNRVNKGLVEALMLRRAKCTVYSVQDTDTLGKDSELASTLAQGKTVIAYVPKINVEERTAQLIGQDPVTIQERLRFLMYADESFASSLTNDDLAFIRTFKALEEFEESRIWRCLPDPGTVQQLQDSHQAEIRRLCSILARSEQRLYDGRAGTLAKSHPLGVQVHLETGVANGVLVVRGERECAELLRRVLTNELTFQLENNTTDRMWYLREELSECAYRVVTQDRKLTNCFWNFYLHK